MSMASWSHFANDRRTHSPAAPALSRLRILHYQPTVCTTNTESSTLQNEVF